MEFKFCPHCGGELRIKSVGVGERLYCDHCRKIQYRNPTVGVAVVYVENDRLLLVRRSGSDAAEVGFFSIDDLPDRMAFPTDLMVCEKLRRSLDSDDFKQYLESSWARY